MKIAVLSTSVIVALSTTLWATPARACDSFGIFPDKLLVPFAGSVVPRNATLQVFNQEFAGVTNMTLVGPAGDVTPPSWDEDEEFAVEPGDNDLAVGPYTLTVTLLDEERVFTFDVEDRIDLDDTAVTATVTRSTGGNAIWATGFCGEGGPAWPTTVLTIVFDEDVEPEQMAVVLSDEGAVYGPVDGVIGAFTSDGELPLLSAIDFAGNARAVSLVEVDSCGGCSSVSAVPTSLLALGLLLRRRRRAP